MDQVLVLSRLAEARSSTGRFSSTDVGRLFDDLALPKPVKPSNVLGRLRSAGLMTRLESPGSWRLTPKGRRALGQIVDDMDLAALVAEANAENAPTLGATLHPLILPSLAPPGLLPALREFLAEHPFDLNVFGMTRFPDEQDDEEVDPVAEALNVAREACRRHGLEFHLASDGALVDDLWGNVTARMWACRYGVGFFENRRDRGLNYNLTIEVGGMLVTGRRCALLKDKSIDRMPTDLVGHIYRSVDLDDPADVDRALHAWLRDDLALGECAACPDLSS